MGYPMTYRRVVMRGQLLGGYDGAVNNGAAEEAIGGIQWGYMPWAEMRAARDPNWRERGADDPRNQIAGDLRRLEADQRGEQQLVRYAALAEITPAQAKTVLDALFGIIPLPYV